VNHTYWFKPWTHWHEISESCYRCLLRAGYGPDRLKTEIVLELEGLA
jgi:hypothetical protein